LEIEADVAAIGGFQMSQWGRVESSRAGRVANGLERETGRPGGAASRWLGAWQLFYRLAIGFWLVPVAAWWRGDDGASWRLLPFFVLVLLVLRLLPSVVRRVVPFPTELTAEWSRQRFLAKRFDSYQWRKLGWFGLGLAASVLIGNAARLVPSLLAVACLVGGGLGVLRWRFLVGSGRVASFGPRAQ
jgi:hypothetical protein